MSKIGDQPTRIKATIIYQSGREEIKWGKLNKNGMPDKRYQAHMAKLRNFPIVKEIKTERLP